MATRADIEMVLRARDEATRILQQARRELEAFQRAVARSGQQAGQASSGVTTFSQRVQGIQNATRPAAQGVQELGVRVQQAAQQARDAQGRFTAASDSVERIGPAASRAAQGLAALAQGAIAGAAAFVAFKGLDVVMSGVGAAVDFVGANLIGLNDRLQQAEIGFTTMLGSAQAARSFLDDLAHFAATTPFDFPELVQASQRMLAMGFAADEIVPLLTAVGDSVAALGAGSQGIDRVTLAIGQMRSRTKVAAQEMLQLTEVGIPAWQLLADHIGVSVSQLQDMVSAGEVAADTFIEAFQKFSQANFGGMMERQAQTWSGALSNIQDTLSMAVAETGRAFFELLQDGAVALAEFTSSSDFQQWAQEVESKVRGAADSLRAFVTDNRDDLLGIAQAFGDLATNAGGLAESLGEAAVRFSEFLNAGRESEGGQLTKAKEDIEDIANLLGVLTKIVNSEAPTEAEWVRLLGGPPEFHEALIAVLERIGAVAPDVTRNTAAIKSAIEDLTGGSIRSLQDFEASIGVSFANVDGVYQFFVGRTKEAHEQVMKWADAVGQAEPITGAYGDVLFEAGEATEQFAAAQDTMTREGHRAIQTARELGVAVSDLADAYQPVTAAARVMAGALSDLGVITSTLDLQVKTSADGINHWKGEMGDVERAIAIVKEQIARTGDPTGELAAKLATLSDIQARLAAGIRDDLEPAFVDSVIFRGELHKQLDELQRRFENNEISQEQFAEAAAEIRSKLEEAQSPFGDLISKMDDLIAKVAELVDSLGELDGIHARPQVTVDGLVLAGAGEMGFTEFDGGPAVTGVAKQIGDVSDALDNLNQKTAEVVVNLQDHATEPIDQLKIKIVDLDGTSFTITANVDIAGALNAIAELDRHMPHSPAEKGPLSVLPNWDALFEGIAASAEHWTEEALKHLRTYVDTAKAIFDTFEAEIDLSASIAQFQRGGGQLPALEDVAPLTAFAQGVTQQLGESAAAFEEDFLKHAQTYASAARAGLDLIESAVGVLAELDGVTVNLERALASASAMKFLIEHIVLSLGDSAAIIESGEGVDHPSVRGAGFVGLASTFAEQARPAVELIAAGAEAFTALNNVEGSLDRALQAASAIKFLVEHIVLAIGDSAAVVTSDVDHPSARGGGFVDLAGEYAENAREAVALVNDALEFLSGLAELRGGVRLEQALAAASDLKFLVEHIVLSIGDAAAALAGSGTPEARPEGFLSAAREYAEHAGPAIALVSDTLDLLSQMGGAGRLPSLDEARAFADLLAQLTRVVAEAVAAAAAGWREEVNPALTAFQSEAGASLELAGSALDVLEGFEQFAGGRLDISDAAAQQFAARLAGLARLVADAFRAAAEGWNEDVDPALEVFRAEAGGSLELVGQAVDAIQALMELRDPDGKQFDVAKAASELADNMALIIATIVELSEGWAQDADPALAAFHEDATGAFDVVSKAVGAINSLADMSRLGPTAMRTFLHNWEIVMDTFEEIARITEERGLDAAKQTLETIEEIAKTIQAANDAINAMGGDTGGSGSGRSGGGGGTGVGGGSGNMLSGGTPVLKGSITIPSDFEFFSGQQQFDFSRLGLSPETLLDLINRGRGVLDTAGKRLFTDAQIATAIIDWVLGGIPLPFAKGGIVTGRTLALLGDNPSGRELVLPLERADELGFGRAQQPMSAPAGPLVVQLVLDGRVIDERVINVLDTQWDRTLS